MAIVPLFGHEELQARLAEAVARNALPAALLFQGQRGVGKQRLALWLAQAFLCENAGTANAPCGQCQGCHYSETFTHPDLHWFFPRPRLKDPDDLEGMRDDYREAIAQRAEEGGLYAPPSGMDGIFVATVRYIVQRSVLTPAIAKRKVFIIGDAERMVAQEGTEFAANAFLKLLEEPPTDTTIVLTSSEPGALLPTIRSRVSTVRVPVLPPDAVAKFLAHPLVNEYLNSDATLPPSGAERIQLAAGAPGRLLAGEQWQEALRNARRMLDSVVGKPAAKYEAAWTTASTKARGSFADTLDALTLELHVRAKEDVRRGAASAALAATRAIDAVELAKERILTNVSPQLITINLLRDLQELFS
jgi:DNA polymerase-3 subunit delta'